MQCFHSHQKVKFASFGIGSCWGVQRPRSSPNQEFFQHKKAQKWWAATFWGKKFCLANVKHQLLQAATWNNIPDLLLGKKLAFPFPVCERNSLHTSEWWLRKQNLPFCVSWIIQGSIISASAGCFFRQQLFLVLWKREKEGFVKLDCEWKIQAFVFFHSAHGLALDLWKIKFILKWKISATHFVRIFILFTQAFISPGNMLSAPIHKGRWKARRQHKIFQYLVLLWEHWCLVCFCSDVLPSWISRMQESCKVLTTHVHTVLVRTLNRDKKYQDMNCSDLQKLWEWSGSKLYECLQSENKEEIYDS